MKPLISKSDPLYLKRMAKELRETPDGFYYQGKRWHRAYSETNRGFGSEPITRLIIARTCDDDSQAATSFLHLENAVFTDAYGREICATRKAR